MEKKFVQASHLKPGNFLLIDEHVCQVKGVEKSKAGKHGASKVRVTAIGVFDGQKRNLLKPGTDDVAVPIVERGSAQVVADLGANVQIMDTQSYVTLDVKKTEDLSLKSGDEVEYIKCDENIKIVRKK